MVYDSECSFPRVPLPGRPSSAHPQQRSSPSPNFHSEASLGSQRIPDLRPWTPGVRRPKTGFILAGISPLTINCIEISSLRDSWHSLRLSLATSIDRDVRSSRRTRSKSPEVADIIPGTSQCYRRPHRSRPRRASSNPGRSLHGEATASDRSRRRGYYRVIERRYPFQCRPSLAVHPAVFRHRRFDHDKLVESVSPVVPVR